MRATRAKQWVAHRFEHVGGLSLETRAEGPLVMSRARGHASDSGKAMAGPSLGACCVGMLPSRQWPACPGAAPRLHGERPRTPALKRDRWAGAWVSCSEACLQDVRSPRVAPLFFARACCQDALFDVSDRPAL
eukprot:106013-Alexandrium_andersonii.AAC.2